MPVLQGHQVEPVLQDHQVEDNNSEPITLLQIVTMEGQDHFMIIARSWGTQRTNAIRYMAIPKTTLMVVDHFQMVMAAKTGRTDRPSDHSSPSLTKDQYGQLLSMLQQFQIGNAGKTTEDQSASGAVNFAGPFNEEASGDW